MTTPNPMFRAALAAGLTTLLLASTACSSQPRYPISAADARSRGLMVARPEYPIREAQAQTPPPAAAVAAPAPEAAPAESEPAPHAAPSGEVDSADLPPPPPPPGGSERAPHLDRTLYVYGGTSLFNKAVLYSDGPLPLVLIAHHHHSHAKRHAESDDDSGSHKTSAKHSSRKHHGSKTADDSEDRHGKHRSKRAEIRLRRGETLADAAERAHTSVADLRELNGLRRKSRVKSGEVLKVPDHYAYEVEKGDTLYAVAKRFGVEPRTLASANGLSHHAHLAPGRTLKLPTDAEDSGESKHAEGDATPVAGSPTRLSKAERPKLAREEARHHGRASASSDEETETAAASQPSRRGRAAYAAAAANRWTPPVTPPPSYAPAPQTAPASSYAAQTPAPSYAAPAHPYSSTTLPAPAYRSAEARSATASPPRYHVSGYTPGSATAQSASGTTSRYGSALPPAPYAASTPYAEARNTVTSPVPTPSQGVPGGVSEVVAQAEATGKGRFVWPLRGQILARFGDNGGQRSDGIDIAVQPGDSVHAAAAGKVMYAGSSIPGLGNMVMVKHADGWVTAYAHLQRLEVRTSDTVAQGQEIGLAGQSGAVDRPLLHFEIRYAPDPAEKAHPIDPATLLPSG